MHIIIGLILFFVLLVLVFDIDVAQKVFKVGFIIVGLGIALLVLSLLAKH
ncbi:hypothetical protein PSHI8_24250 [Polynucleobacter sp. SHI8]|nr:MULTISPECIES: hypothetical protein [unclassified Polynucleobacter]BDW12341.1 hypothetical protein PSHI2_24230 [Polynucleobacter sp. SHI2]BDW14789.1 hypothetical protein PSHI8_24250 [Polynucleobacter sp. SHI8]